MFRLNKLGNRLVDIFFDLIALLILAAIKICRAAQKLIHFT